MRFVWRRRSLTKLWHSRVRRRASSSSTEGTRTIEQTRGSPRDHAISARSSASTSRRSVFTRRARRSTGGDAGSITWLSVPWPTNKRCSQKQSRPAS